MWRRSGTMISRNRDQAFVGDHLGSLPNVGSLHSAPAYCCSDSSLHRQAKARKSSERQRTLSSSSKFGVAVLVEPLELTFRIDGDDDIAPQKLNVINANDFAIDAVLTPPDPARYRISPEHGIRPTSQAEICVQPVSAKNVPDSESLELTIARRSDPTDVLYRTSVSVAFKRDAQSPAEICSSSTVREMPGVDSSQLRYYRNVGCVLLGIGVLYSMPPFWQGLGQYLRIVFAFLLGVVFRDYLSRQGV